MTGKIIKGIAGFYYVNNGENKVYQCKAKGVFRNRKIKPLVGDDVEFSVLDEETMEGNIDEILPRKNELIRPAPANVDQALVLFALTHPAPNLNLLDRFLVMMSMEDIPVKLCFNKQDLGDEALMEQYRSIYEAAGYPVYFISAREETGIEQVRSLLRGKTTVLAGPSGVGKSSLTNRIQPEADMETGDISRKIERGKHTTRHVEIFDAYKDAKVFDTPGFTSFEILEAEEDNLQAYYPEFEPYAGSCRYDNCRHIKEPGCTVQKAVSDGRIHPKRYDSYVSNMEEIRKRKR